MKFVFAADMFGDLSNVAMRFRCVKNGDIFRGITVIIPLIKPFRRHPYIHKMAQKILIFENA